MRIDEQLWEYNKLVSSVYKEQGLDCLRGLDNKYLLKGRPILSWHNEVTRKCAIKHNGHFYYMQNIDDILLCSDELLYFTALLFLYRPYINNPLEEAFYFNNKMVYPNYQNYYAKLYSMFADTACEKAYNFWDRIGDMLASFFPDKIEAHKVFFPISVDIIPLEFRNSPNYSWLQNFKETHYKDLNIKRKHIVHYISSDTEYQYNHLEKGISNKEEMEKIQEQRLELADFYKQHITLTFEGLEKSLLFLEELSNALYGDIN